MSTVDPSSPVHPGLQQGASLPPPVSRDPWAHRSEGMRCHSCMWYVDKVVQIGHERVGRCRKRAPTMDGFPVVFSTDWCGDHKLDHEEKKV